MFRAETPQLGKIACAIGRRMVSRGRRDRHLVWILAEQNLGRDVARQPRLGPNAPRRSDRDHQRSDERSPDDQPNNELQHTWDCSEWQHVRRARFTSRSHHSPEWWNGRHDGLKIRCSQGREGSNPSSGTHWAGVTCRRPNARSSVCQESSRRAEPRPASRISGPSSGTRRRSRVPHSHDVPDVKLVARKVQIRVGSAEPDAAQIRPEGRLTYFHATAHESMNRWSPRRAVRRVPCPQI